MDIRFTKMQGLGNDFMVIDGIHQTVSLTPERIMRWADRHYGVGFDQLLLLSPARSKDADFHYRIFNADGTEVAQCGNGARCIAKFALDQGLTSSMLIKVQTNETLLELQVEEEGQVKVNMGLPEFQPDKIPLIVPYDEYYRLSGVPVYGDLIFQALSMGNPHAIIFCDALTQNNAEIIGDFFNQQAIFPEGVNVGFVQLLDPYHIELTVYERGAGLTLACGSGACAAVVAGIHAGKLQTTVKVSQRGGDLIITWQGLGYPVYMSGPAETVFEGRIAL
jgi:diaminopimelate epimerase